MTSARSHSILLSLTFHAGAIALALFVSQRIPPPAFLTSSARATPLVALFPRRPVVPAQKTPGGGGGAHRQLPATAGRLPKIAPRQFVPPALEILNLHPALAMEMSIEAPPETVFPDRSLPTSGDPLGAFVNGSAGYGGPLGIGNRAGTGIGDRRGAAAGLGDGGTGTVYRPGHGITVPVLLHSVEPEFSEEARRAKYSGTVTLRADIDAFGRPRNIRIVHGLGMGLDEKAIGAVTRWHFRPGTKDGQPVAVTALIEVMFHLL